MISRLDQQYKVNQLMMDCYDLSGDERICNNKALQKYMRSYLQIVTCISTALSLRAHDEARIRDKKSVWNHLKEQDYPTYVRLRYDYLGIAMNLGGKTGRKISETCYRAAQYVYGFN